MNAADLTTSPMATIDRLVRATNDHDLEGLVDGFEPGHRNETPAHPARGFTGRDQVRANWQQMFAAVPDVHTHASSGRLSRATRRGPNGR